MYGWYWKWEGNCLVFPRVWHSHTSVSRLKSCELTLKSVLYEVNTVNTFWGSQVPLSLEKKETLTCRKWFSKAMLTDTFLLGQMPFSTMPMHHTLSFASEPSSHVIFPALHSRVLSVFLMLFVLYLIMICLLWEQRHVLFSFVFSFYLA